MFNSPLRHQYFQQVLDKLENIKIVLAANREHFGKFYSLRNSLQKRSEKKKLKNDKDFILKDISRCRRYFSTCDLKAPGVIHSVSAPLILQQISQTIHTCKD